MPFLLGKVTIAGKAKLFLARGEIMSEIEVQSGSVPAAGLSQWERVSNTFTAPSKTFDDIKRGNKSWWMPLLIMSLVSYILFAAVYTKIGMRTVVDNQMRMDPATAERMAKAPPEQREMGAKISLYITEGVFAASPVMVLLVAAVVALVLWGTINFVFGGKATFGGIFAMWFYASLPSIIKTLLGVVVIYAGMAPDSFNIKNFAPTNLAALMLDPVETNKALYALATSLDVITIWTLVLLSIGTATLAGTKRGSGYMAVFGWWAIIVLFGVGMAAVRG
jgi:hypothetical protein